MPGHLSPVSAHAVTTCIPCVWWPHPPGRGETPSRAESQHRASSIRLLRVNSPNCIPTLTAESTERRESSSLRASNQDIASYRKKCGGQAG
jgi:hypothetical protein